MHKPPFSDNLSEETEEKSMQESLPCNQIFLNFTREYRCPDKVYCNVAKVKELFRYLSKRQDLQEMKISGWSDDSQKDTDEDKDEDDDNDDSKDGVESSYELESTPKSGGQRFAMSRDYWYRKLNTLKAQKLDEVALEAKDIPSESKEAKDPKCMKWLRNHKIYSNEIPEKKEDIMREIDEFSASVAKPVEEELKSRFVNVYDRKCHFKTKFE